MIIPGLSFVSKSFLKKDYGYDASHSLGSVSKAPTQKLQHLQHHFVHGRFHP